METQIKRDGSAMDVVESSMCVVCRLWSGVSVVKLNIVEVLSHPVKYGGVYLGRGWDRSFNESRLMVDRVEWR